MRKFKKFFIVAALMLSVAGIAQAKPTDLCYMEVIITSECNNSDGKVTCLYSFEGSCEGLAEAIRECAKIMADNAASC